MKTYIYITIGVVLTAAGLLAASCTDYSDYNEVKGDPAVSGNLTLWENIRQNAQLSDFASLVQKAGFDDELSQSHYYTVWAPLNGTFDASACMQLDDASLLRQFVLNHIADFGHHATGQVNERVRMLNGKSYSFVGSGTYTFDERVVSQPNQPSSNGVMHVMDGAAVYLPNLYDFVTDSMVSAGKGIDSLRSYFKRYEQTYLDENASVVGPIVNGVQTYIDSVMVTYNTLTRAMRASIEQEDSLYTFLMPSNTAWVKAYERIKPCFNYIASTTSQAFVEQAGSTVISNTPATFVVEDPSYLQDSVAKAYLVRNLVFSHNDGYNRWLQGQPTLQGADTLRSTMRSKFSNPADVLSDAYLHEQLQMSNGVARIVDSLAFYPWESFAYGRSFGARAYLARVATGNTHYTSVNLTGMSEYEFARDGSLRYVWAEPNGGYSKPEVDIYLPDLVSTTYDFYCVFVPEAFDNPKADGEYLPNRVMFSLSYCDADGRLRSVDFLDERDENKAACLDYLNRVKEEKGTTGVVADNASNRTTLFGFSNNPDRVDTVYIGRFTFPVSYLGLGSENNMICPNIKITSPFSVFNNTFMAAFSRDLRVAAILAKPVELVEYEESNKQ